MSFARAVYLLFFLNFVDGIVTIIWVQSGLAPEANPMMAALLDAGVLPFLLVKLGIGVIACLTLLRGSDYALARIGVVIALTVYSGTIGFHILTGLAAAGYLS